MELRDLNALVHVAATGSLRAAAGQLHLTPAAVHKQLKALERDVGVRLYSFAGLRLRLSPAAQILLPYAHTLLAQHQAALHAIDEYNGLRQGSVRLGAGPTIASYVVPRILKRFRNAFPTIEIKVETGSSAHLLDLLGHGEIDIAFLIGDQREDPHYRQHLHWQFEMALVDHGNHAETSRISIASLAKTPMILFQQTARIQSLIDAWFRKCEFTPRVAMRLDNADAIKAMVQAGLGASMLPYWAVAADVGSGALSMVRTKEPAPVGYISMLTNAQLYQPASVGAFLKLASSVPKRELHLTPPQHPAC